MFTEGNVVELISTVLGTAVFALVGFVWKISHRVTELANRLDALERSQRRDMDDVRRDVDTLYSKVDKDREWTTSRMMSIAKDIKG